MSENQKFTFDIKDIEKKELDDVADLLEESDLIFGQVLGAGDRFMIVKAKDGSVHLAIDGCRGDFHYCKLQVAKD